jgi:hypothetical protein
MAHQIIEFDGRKYTYDPDCACAGCTSLKTYPIPSKCDWCHATHCGGPEHCRTEEHGGGDKVLGADQAVSAEFEGFIDDVCGIVLDRIKNITATIKEMSQMIPNYQQDIRPTSTRRGGANQNRQRSGHQYLRVEDLSADPTVATIRSCRVETDNFRPDRKLVSVKMTLNGEIRLWSIRDNNPNLDVLKSAFGPDENDWVDKKISLVAEEDEHSGRQNIAAEPFSGKEPKKGK